MRVSYARIKAQERSGGIYDFWVALPGKSEEFHLVRQHQHYLVIYQKSRRMCVCCYRAVMMFLRRPLSNHGKQMRDEICLNERVFNKVTAKETNN